MSVYYAIICESWSLNQTKCPPIAFDIILYNNCGLWCVPYDLIWKHLEDLLFCEKAGMAYIYYDAAYTNVRVRAHTHSKPHTRAHTKPHSLFDTGIYVFI